MSNSISQRALLEKGLNAAIRESDKLVVTVSSGVLALSVALVGQIKSPSDVGDIKLAWIAFLSAIASVLLSLVFEQIERFTRIHKIDLALLIGDVSHRDVSHFWGKIVLVLNIVGHLSFLYGLSMLGVFLSTNLVK